MKRIISAALSVALISPPAAAQTATEPTPQAKPVAAAPAASEPLPLVAQTPAAAPEHVLPANTEILLSMNEELSSKKNDEGDSFSMTVVHDVMLGNYVVIPKGSRAVGEITWKTGKGAFGKSGKMEIELRYVEVGGRRVPIEGSYRQEGEGNTVATVAGVVAAGVFAAFITGKSARIPQGRELKAHTTEAIPVVMAAAQPVPTTQPLVAVPQPAPPVVVPAAATSTAVTPAPSPEDAE